MLRRTFLRRQQSYTPPPPSPTSKVFTYGYTGPPLQRDKTPREQKIVELTEEVFAKGNRHIKNVNAIRILPSGMLSFPEVCICGHTGSGKSKLIASVLHNARLGRGGRHLGNTKYIQMFSVGDSFMLCDTPGYGAWDQKHINRPLVRSIAQSVTKQYIALRKHANLKRVYLAVAADVGIRPRDVEFINFLCGEGVPFTILMTRLDNLVEHETKMIHENNFQEMVAEIPAAAERIFEKLGTDRVPFLEVCSRTGLNIDALQCDMVFHCTQELKRDDQLTVANFRELSYSPPSAQAVIEAEQKYPPEHELLIDNDAMTAQEFIEEHKRQLRFDSKRESAFLCGGSTDLANGVSLLDFASNRAPKDPRREHFAIDTTKKPMLLMPASASTSSAIASSSSSSLLLSGGEDHESSSSSSASSSSLLPVSDDTNSDHDKAMSALEVRSSSSTSSANNTISERNSFSSSSSSVLLGDEGGEDNRSCVVKPPASLIQDKGVAERLEHFINKTPQRYKRLVENGWNTVMQRDDFFLDTDHRVRRNNVASLSRSQQPDEDWRPSAFAERRRNVNKKYIDMSGHRKERALKVDAQGYYCPFVGQEAATGRSVVGISGADEPSSVGGPSRGGRMLGLKRTGFGGNSFSDQTFKGKGRATRKFNKWAR